MILKKSLDMKRQLSFVSEKVDLYPRNDFIKCILAKDLQI